MSKQSIYKSPEGEAEIMVIYDNQVDRLGIDYEDRMVNTRFGPTHVLVTGPEDAPPLVILHGGNSVNPMTLAWFLPLTKEYRVYAPDTMGHPGKSAQTRLAPRDNSYGEWIVDVLDSLALESVPFIGPSYGAGILIRTAVYAPERISQAVLLVPSGIVSVPIFSMIFKIGIPYLLYRWFPSQKRLVRAVRWMFTEEPDENTLQIISSLFLHVEVETEMPHPATREELQQFKAPTLVIAAEKDVMFPADKVLPRAKQIIPDLIAAECLEGSCHFPSKQGQEYIENRVRRFLKETR